MHFLLRANRNRLAVMFLIIVSLYGCKTQNLFQQSDDRNKKGSTVTDSSVFAIRSDYQYTIRSNDKIIISVWDHDDVSVGSLYGIYNSNEVYGKWLLVNARGEVNVPKIGAFALRGLTVIQAEDTLRKAYAAWIKSPIVDLKVLNKEVTVMGELKSPGKQLLEKDNNTLVELLAKAGDFDFYANKKKIKVIRVQNGQPHEITIDLTAMDNFMARNIQIIPGDIIYVPAKKGKDFDKRVSTIIPFVSIVTAFAIGYATFF